MEDRAQTQKREAQRQNDAAEPRRTRRRPSGRLRVDLEAAYHLRVRGGNCRREAPRRLLLRLVLR